jgi:hypothetical protein
VFCYIKLVVSNKKLIAMSIPRRETSRYYPLLPFPAPRLVWPGSPNTATPAGSHRRPLPAAHSAVHTAAARETQSWCPPHPRHHPPLLSQHPADAYVATQPGGGGLPRGRTRQADHPMLVSAAFSGRSQVSRPRPVLEKKTSPVSVKETSPVSGKGISPFSTTSPPAADVTSNGPGPRWCR